MKISIIGCGKVGSSAAFALLYSVNPDEIVLIDRNEDRAKAEELDLGHAAVAVSLRTKIIGFTNIEQTKDSDFVIITAGKPRTPDSNETREDLAKINEPIIREFMKKIIKVAPKAQVIIVTNPSTQMGEIAREFTNKVTTMDTQLDTARLRYFISREGFDLENIESKTYGEHGENMQIDFKENLTEEQKEKIINLTKGAGRNIINGKGYTNWGIAVQICEEIKRLKNA